MVALDLSRAFDTVSHTTLFSDIMSTNIHNQLKRWLIGYLRGRQSYVEFRNTRSKYRKIRQGVPQGGVLSPTLFNLYMCAIPEPPSGINLLSYADDCTLLASGPDIEELSRKLNSYLNILNNWFVNRSLSLSKAKSSATLFTSWTKEVGTQLNIKIDNERIPTTSHPKILGVTFDQLLTFNAHSKQIRSRLKTRNNALKCIAGSTWGKQKETIVTAYKTICRPLINYAAPVWTPQLNDIHWKNLQTSQNAALRTATGCHLMTDIDHLHCETNILPVKDHNMLLSKQYVLACHQSSHPSNDIIQNDPPPRKIRSTATAYIDHIKKHAPDHAITTAAYKKGLKNIHTEVVTKTLTSYRNKVLDAPPPIINTEEINLSRNARSTLAQLRSGKCRILNNYMNRIEPTIEDKCPLCNMSPHDTKHLFNCRLNKTTLTTGDLWAKPTEVASFLGLESIDD